MGTRTRCRGSLVWLGALIAASLLVASGGLVAVAQDDPGHPVDIAGVVVLRIRVPVDGREPLEQVATFYQRWVDILEETKEDLSPDLVRIEEQEGEPVIYVGSIPLIRVDEAHARLNATTPNGLAEVWASNLRRAILRYMEIHGML